MTHIFPVFLQKKYSSSIYFFIYIIENFFLVYYNPMTSICSVFFFIYQWQMFVLFFFYFLCISEKYSSHIFYINFIVNVIFFKIRYPIQGSTNLRGPHLKSKQSSVCTCPLKLASEKIEPETLRWAHSKISRQPPDLPQMSYS